MITLFFVVEGKNLEAQSSLLVSTLIAHNGPEYRLVAYTPPDNMDALSPVLRTFYDRSGVEVRPIAPDPSTKAGQLYAKSGWARPYPHGNKILAAASPREDEWSVFLDTDMVCAAPLELASLQEPNRLAVVPEGVPSWGKNSDRWERAYAHFGLEVPSERVRLTRRRRIEFLPYFNAGFVMFPNAPRSGANFGAQWLETALDFDHHCSIGQKRPWLDQITLPLTIKRFGYDYLVADTALNFSISDRAFEPEAKPVLLHYHRWRFLHAWHQGKKALDHIAGPDLAARMRRHYAEFNEMEAA
jgi:hypothetical protein